jgi:hypothetical protein
MARMRSSVFTGLFVVALSVAAGAIALEGCGGSGDTTDFSTGNGGGDTDGSAGAAGGSAGSSGSAGAGGSSGAGGSAGAGGSSGAGGSAGAGGSGGAGGSAGAGGSSGAGGSAGAGGSGGAGGGDGGVTCPTNCPDGSYCDPTLGQCVSCTDTTRLVFGNPVKLGVSNGPGANQAFPRVQNDGQIWRMDYRYTEGNTNDQLATGGGYPFGSGTALSGAGINTSGVESGPLPLPPATPVPGVVGASTGYFLLFDSDRSGRREIYAAAGIGAATATAIPGAINQGSDDYHVAYAYKGASRFWWTSTRDFGGSTKTGLVSMDANGSTVVPVPIVLPLGCHTKTADLAPWVTPDGNLLFFHSQEWDPATGCQQTINGGQVRLYVVAVDPTTGLPLGTASEVTQIMNTSWRYQTPSLSPDMCALFFATDGGKNELDIYRATRM